jgi:hypothetical protein
MSYKSLLRNGAILIAASIITLTACKRKDTTTANNLPSSADDNGGYASDAAKLDQSSNDVISISDAAGITGGTNLRTTATTIGACATVTNDTTVTPHKLTIDFGPTDCTCLDLKRRRGKIIVTYAGHYKDSGSKHTITLSNYFVNDIQITGSKTVTNMGANGLGQVWYNVTVSDSIILGTDSIISWTGNRTRTWLAGYSTADRSDDVYAIGGTTVLTRANGHVFTHAISSTDPLKIALACSWIESGTVTISSTSFVGGDRVLNYGYGGGGCDDLAELTIAGHTYHITLH